MNDTYRFLCEREPNEDPSKYTNGGLYPKDWTDRWEKLYQRFKGQGEFRKVKLDSGKLLNNLPEVVSRSLLQEFCRGTDAGVWDAEIARAQAANKIHPV